MNKEHEIVLPHEKNEGVFDSKSLIPTCDLVWAEVSYPSTGQGIELGWADKAGIPIICFYKKGKRPSGSLKAVSGSFFTYQGVEEMIEKMRESIEALVDKKPSS